MNIVAILWCVLYLFVAGGLYSFLRRGDTPMWEAFVVAALWPAILLLTLAFSAMP